MDNSVTVSVIVPAYNAKDTIGRCLASLVSQDGVKLDIVVVDDGSTDGTSDLLDGFAARHDCVKVMHIENGGPSRARNAGLEASSGEYVAFCDADDWLDAGCLANAAEAAEGHSADVVVFGYKNIRARSTRTHAWCAERRMDAREFAERCLLDPRVRGFTWNKLYSRELVALARFPEGVRVCEDLLFNLEIARRKEELVAICIPGATYNYDLTGESLTRGEGIYQAMRRVLLGLDDDAMAASASRGALYAAAAKASLEMTRGGGVAPCVDDLVFARDFYLSRSCPASEKLKVAARRVVALARDDLPASGASDECGAREGSHPGGGAQGEQTGHRDGRR